MSNTQTQSLQTGSETQFIQEILQDYYTAVLSREASLIGRKEVLTGKAKFGIFGDGKELPQLALARAFSNGDFRTGYYRDQTFCFATGIATVQQFFSQLYADTDLEAEPHSGGRQMNSHFATRSLNAEGQWNRLTDMKNTAADSSPTASQMCRAVGLGLASKLYRSNPNADTNQQFSVNGNEITWATIGDASTSEGVFFEAINAAGVLQIPMVVSVWDDGYGISVPQKYQTTKESISDILQGFESHELGKGFAIFRVKAWKYDDLIQTYQEAAQIAREQHKPVLIHVQECTQPQGHSTSGSHERYKSKDRLSWEEEYDCIRQFRLWILAEGFATEAELDVLDENASEHAKTSRADAWSHYLKPIQAELKDALAILGAATSKSANPKAQSAFKKLQSAINPGRKEILLHCKEALRAMRAEQSSEKSTLLSWIQSFEIVNKERFNSHLFSESNQSVANITPVPAQFSADSKRMNGYELINIYFKTIFAKHSNVFAYGEDVGKIGDVNQGFAGLQEEFGENRIFDVGIRELTIMGQAIGMAMRGMRPIAEIQYLDYLIYGLQPLVDDLATLQYRTRGGQKAPAIIRTRGHRLEGIWHTGSPMGMMIHSLRGIHVCVPRSLCQAAGMYNTLLASDEPGIVVECLNGYRLKETMPDNLADFKLELGVPEILKTGTDITLVTYGSCVRVAEEAIQQLEEVGISVELIDVQTLLPFDIHGIIAQSIEKTNRVVFFDEDVPGGASSYMLQQVLEVQNGYVHLDSKPITISAEACRSPYGSDGDYFVKPNAEIITERIYALLQESNPNTYGGLY